MSAETALERAEELAERLLPDRTPKRRMLVIVNPYATTVSDRLRNLVVYALQSRYSVEAIDTEKREHATQICREAAREGYDVVVAFGGDGTVNEAANGLVGSETPLTALPGGSTNVWARTLGIPNDVVDATEHLLRMADEFQPLPRGPRAAPGGRHFVFASGVGLDASVVERVDRHPLRKARYGAWYYAYAAVDIFNRHYLVRPPHVRVRADGRTLEGVTVIVQNSDPFTYFRKRPIRVASGAGLTSGSLGAAVLQERHAAGAARRWCRGCSPAGPRPCCATARWRAWRAGRRCAWRRSTTSPSPCRWTATTSASSARSSSARCRARCWPFVALSRSA